MEFFNEFYEKKYSDYYADQYNADPGGLLPPLLCNYSKYVNGLTTVEVDFVDTDEYVFNPFVFDYITDEHLFVDPTITDVVQPNTHPAGAEVLTFREAVDIAVNGVDMYSDATSRSFFKEASNGRVPDFEYVLNTSGTNFGYFASTTLFKVGSPWFESFFIVGSGNWYPCGRSENGDGTYLRTTAAGELLVKIGGGAEVSLGTILSTTLGNSIAFLNKDIGGGVYADTIWVNGAAVRTDNTANRGTTDSDKPATFGAIWDTWAGGETVADAGFLGSGGLYNSLRTNTSFTPVAREISGIHYRNSKHFLVFNGGDSVTAGTGVAENPWWLQIADRAKSLKYRMEFVNGAVGGTPRYAGSPEVPSTGFTQDVFGTGDTIVPNADQSVEFVYDKFYPECVLFGSGINQMATTVDKNPNGTGSLTDSTLVGNNAISDEQIWYTLHQKLKYEELGILYFSSTVQPSNSTSLVSVDDVPLRDALKIIGDNELSYYVDNELQFDYINTLSTDGAGTGYDPDYSDEEEEVHPNVLGTLQIVGEVIAKTDPIFIASRDRNFQPIIEYLTLNDGDTVNDGTLAVDWYHDGTLVSDTEVLTEGLNTITRTWTNTYGRVGTKSIEVNYVIQPTPRNYWPMTTEVTGEILDEQGVDNLTVLGTPSITGVGMRPLASGDGAITSSVYEYCPLNASWSFEYKVTLLSGSNIFSGQYHIGIQAPFNTGVTAVQFSADDLACTLQNTQNAGLTSDDRVLGWKTAATEITIQFKYNHGTGLGEIIADGVSFPSLNKGALRAALPFSIGVRSSSDTVFTPSASNTGYLFRDVKYWDELI